MTSTLTLALLAANQVVATVAVPGDITVNLSRQPISQTEVGKRIADVVRAEASALNAAARDYWKSKQRLGLLRNDIPFLAPRVVRLSPNPNEGRPHPASSPINLVFEPDNTTRGFSPAYRQLLQATFAAAKPTMDAMFGQPYLGGNVRVENRDDVIGDRDAVAGGFYIPDDGSGNQVIWFPVYNLPETAVVNLVHCLFLAYMGPGMPTYNAWSEGFARAATMQLVKSPSNLPGGMDPESIESIVEATYDNSIHYDWYNQPPLGNSKFIADNLRNLPLPPGGSLGGIFLMRYKMAGTAWAKFIDRYGPGFFAAFFATYYPAVTNNSSVASDIPLLKQFMQNTMDTLQGANSTIEGRSFADWYQRQYILDTSISRGKRMFVEPIPITSGLFGSDYGVFAIWATYFETLANGNETLLSGTCYPLFWNPDFNRVFPEGQTDRMDIAAAFGEVTPNLTDDFGGDFYRATVELPVADVIGRALLPVGSIATPQNPIPTDLYGTVMGFDGAVTGGNPNISGRVRITFLDLPATNPIDAPIKNGAFGVDVGTAFDSPRRLQVEVIKRDTGIDTVLHTEYVNTWAKSLGLDIRINEDVTWNPVGGVSAGVQGIGFPLTPYETDMAVNLGLNPGETLVARWRQDLFRYEMYPSMAPFQGGRGYFVRMPSASPSFSIFGRGAGPQPYSVSLQPGWNQICNPFTADLALTNVTIQRTVDLPRTLDDAITAGLIDPILYRFVAGAPDPFSGVPEGGTLVAADAFTTGMPIYIRVLAPEGLTITFRPTTATLAYSRQPRYRWRGSLEFSGLQVEKSVVEIGSATWATNGFDQGVDSNLPPIWGGALQAQIDSQNPMYRDIRGPHPSPWKLKLTGLRRGATYSFTPTLASGDSRVPILVFEDGGRRRPLISGRTYRFTATGSERTIVVRQVSQ